MNINNLKVGDTVKALSDRVLAYEACGQNLVLWEKGQVLKIEGIFQHGDQVLEYMIRLDDLNHENVPAPLMPELFITQPSN